MFKCILNTLPLKVKDSRKIVITVLEENAVINQEVLMYYLHSGTVEKENPASHSKVVLYYLI